MEEKINIAEILKDKPEDTELWTDMFGRVTLYVVTDACDAFQVKHHNKEPWFDKDGKFCKEGVLCIYPSKSMRDWHKFAWKKGDVLVSNDGKREVLFKTWVNDSYTKFVGLHCLIINDNEEVEYDNGTTVFNTNDFKGIDAEDAAQTYINTIEEKLGGKLNRETLEVQANINVGDVVSDDVLYGICTKVNNSNVYCDFGCDSANYNAPITKLCLQKENVNVVMPTNKEAWYKEIEKRHHISIDRNTLEVQPEFKDGDIVTQCVLKGVNVCIIKNCIDKIDNKYNYYARYNTQDKEINYDDWSYISPFAKFATDSEKQQLFDALAKKGKTWNAEKKQIVDLKPKFDELKPFDNVLVRHQKTEEWRANIFSHTDKTDEYLDYVCVNGRWEFCIPYEGNESLLGTTKDVEG